MKLTTEPDIALSYPPAGCPATAHDRSRDEKPIVAGGPSDPTATADAAPRPRKAEPGEPLARQFGARTRLQTGLDILNFRSSPQSVVDWVDVGEDA
jgi:hypothetical protein